jgi:hypothetical protein
MSSKREGEHPARAFGATGGGFAEGQAGPEEFEEDKQVGSFATGQEDAEEFPEDEQLGSFAKGQEKPETLENMGEGTFGTVEGPPNPTQGSEPEAIRPKPTHDEISVRAYFIYLEAPECDELGNWLRAERELTPA